MAQAPDVIRQNIEETRGDLTRKLETLECEVIGTVKGTRAAVAETIETVKDQVESAVENVKDTLEETLGTITDSVNVRLQTQRHPWPMFGASIFAGYLLGSLAPSVARITSSARSALPAPSYPVEPAPPIEAAPRRPSLVARLLEQFAPEVEKLKGLAIGVTAGIVRDVLKDHVPESIAPHVRDTIHSMTQRLGGAKIEGPILAEQIALGR